MLQSKKKLKTQQNTKIIIKLNGTGKISNLEDNFDVITVAFGLLWSLKARAIVKKGFGNSRLLGIGWRRNHVYFDWHPKTRKEQLRPISDRRGVGQSDWTRCRGAVGSGGSLFNWKKRPLPLACQSSWMRICVASSRGTRSEKLIRAKPRARQTEVGDGTRHPRDQRTTCAVVSRSFSRDFSTSAEVASDGDCNNATETLQKTAVNQTNLLND